MTSGHYRLPQFLVPKDSTASVLRHTVKDHGSVLDLSSATGPLLFNAKDSEGVEVVTGLAAAFATDGSDGVIQVQLTSALVGTVRDVTCEWEIQGYNGGVLKSFPFTLRVLPSAKAD